MKYLCLIYSDESAWVKMTQEEQSQVMKDYFEFTSSIRARVGRVTRR